MAKPLLRWAGGKRWLTGKISNHLPKVIKGYYEPFCGSCAIYYSLKDHLGDVPAYLSDLNRELIEFYRVLQDNPSELINYLREYENTESFYYYIRGITPTNNIESAARFYYLNRTSFNGIYRVNLNGKYNVPYGFKNYITLFNFDLIYESSDLLKNAIFVHDDFNWIVNMAGQDDFVFVDPPYTVSHNKNGFIKYNKKLFSFDDQKRLKVFLDLLTMRGVRYLMTNAHHSAVYDVFSFNSTWKEIERYTSISGEKKGRNFTKEYIFSNYDLSSDGET